MTEKKISIVTPSYNQGEFIEETICSILDQGYSNLEYMIIDGGSNDNTVEIIKKYEKHLSYWVSEKDKGQSHAINKGIKTLTGDVFNWINSDDIVLPGTFKEVNKVFQNKEVLCYGGKVKHYINGELSEFNSVQNIKDVNEYWNNPKINQPSTYYSVKAIEKMGLLNSRLHYAMDYEWWLKFLYHFGPEKAVFNNEFLSGFRLHDASKTETNSYIFQKDIANQLFQLTKLVGLESYSKPLESGYEIYNDYKFDAPVKKEDKEQIKNMVTYFLLKWHSEIYNEQDFNIVKSIKENIDLKDVKQIKSEWVTKIENYNLSNWTSFKLKRKIRSIFS